MASVKWLARMTAIPEPFRGFFQAERYVVDGEPIGPIAPRTVIVSPTDGADIRGGGSSVVRGYAWGGRGGIARVEVSLDGGVSWHRADLGEQASDFAWAPWTFAWQPAGPGDVVLIVRATDRAGALQPLEQNWNALGYMNNAARPIAVRVLT